MSERGEEEMAGDIGILPIRRLFHPFLGLDARTGWALLALFCTTRFALILYANAGGGYGLATPIFILMGLAPYLILTRTGRRQIGLVRPRSATGLVMAAVAGAGVCLVLAAIFHILFGGSQGDAFAYIARAYPPVPSDPSGRWIMFAIVATMSVLFSPVGEELFFRGLIHESFRARHGEIGASLLDACAFALVHLSHFGLIWTAVGWRFLPVPALLWFVGMGAASLVFSAARRSTGSVWGAVTAHAAFNFAMTAWIFQVVI